MPSPIGHVLGGAAAVWIVDCVPGRRSGRTAPPSASWFARAGSGLTAACAMLAAMPDVDLAFTVHRTVTHSIGAVIVVALCAAGVSAALGRPVLRVTLMCASAYGTHLLLDWMAVDRYLPFGIQALWPFSHQWFISGWDVFAQTERRNLASLATLRQNLAAVAREIAILGPVVVGLWLVRVKALAGLAAELSGGHHPPQQGTRPIF